AAGLCCAMTLGWGSVVDARPIHYEAVDNEALAECDALAWRGDAGAEPCYEALFVGPAPAAVQAEAAWALGDLHAANRLFQSATKSAPDNAAILTRWGDLFADSHQDAEAMELYREALAADDRYAFALLGSARVLVGGFDDAANTYLEPLLTNSSMHPGARTGALLLVARIALENDDLDGARDNLERAEAFIEANDWPPLEPYALRAALDLVNGNTKSEWVARALAYHPAWGDIHAVPAHFYVISRRYRDAIDLYQQAVDVEPGHAAAHIELGVNLLRDNQVNRARRHLETAHDIDPFSPVAVNTLRLLDSFSNFSLIQYPDGPAADGDVPIVLRLHEDESAAIAPYAIELTQQSIEEFTRRYEFELREPVIIELYPDHEDFAVRTAGMPGIGILGATFGYVVAMDSPAARSPNQFQWGTTLWHELAHVFTLEATNHLVPRWFSEGVSVFEEWRSGPTPGVKVPMSVYRALDDDKFLPVATLDQGFIRPTYENQVIVSYMQAGLICQFIDERFGDDRLAAMLREFRDGASTVGAIERVLDVSAPAFDRQFEQFLEEEHGQVLASLDDWQETHTEAARAMADSDWSTLETKASRLVDLHPGYVEPDSPYLMLAKAFEETGRTDELLAAFRTFHELGGYEPDALKHYAQLLEERGDHSGAIAVLRTVAMVQPLDNELHARLGGLYLETERAADALQSFEIVLAQGAFDKANAYFQVAQAHRALGNTDATRDNLLLALDVAPGYRDAQRLLLEIMRGDNGDH
ncbi:MAG: tetratricopeptide repeat protein, partial [Pseudomonadota bacterium]